MKNKLFNILVMGIASMFLFAYTPQLSAVNITLNSVTGVWTSTTGGQNITGLNTNQIRWGYQSNPAQQVSGYDFIGSAPPGFPVSVNTPFNLGTFTHINYPIQSGTGITGAQLRVTTSITIDGTTLNNLQFTYNFQHNETPNVAPCQSGSASVCDDIVTLLGPFSDVFTVNGVNYTLNLLGFQVGNNQFTQFQTREYATNDANLIATITVPVPEPQTYMLLGSFIIVGVISAIAKKRKHANQKLYL